MSPMEKLGIGAALAPEKKEVIEYEILSSPEVRERLKARADQLIDQIDEKHIDSLIFLDRSARPLAWLMRERWYKKHQDDDSGEPPQIKFFNFGKSSGGHASNEQAVIETMRDHMPGTVSEDRSLSQLQQRLDESVEGRWFDTEEVNFFYRDHFKDENWENHESTDQKAANYFRTLSEIRKIYKDEFDRQKVLIVDDISLSGESQLGAHGLFSAAFPNAELFSTAFFRDKKSLFRKPEDREETEVRDYIPWLYREGMAGVLELPDEYLLSKPLNPDNLSRLKEALGAQIDHLTSTIRRLIGTVVDNYDELLPYLEAERPKRAKLAMKGIAEEAKKISRTKKVDPEYARERFWSQLSLIEENTSVKSAVKDTHDSLVYDGILRHLDSIEDTMETLDRVATAYNDYAKLDFETMRNSARQLREEIKRLGQED